MKKGDLIEDTEGRIGVIMCIILCFPEGAIPRDYGSVGFAYFFESQKEEIVYEDEIQVIGEYNGTHILE